MNLKLNVLQLASGLMAHASARQRVVAENVAHADTPGYRARDLADFATTLDQTPGFSGRVTRAGHIPFGADPRGFDAGQVTAEGAVSPNGNTVSLEDQMTRAAEARQSHQMALGVYSKSMDILRTAIGRGR
jgi:flagellar basal-body rod protein FlgB